jgi:MFS family permease
MALADCLWRLTSVDAAVNLQLTDHQKTLLGLYGPAMVMSMGQGMVVPTIPVLAGTFELSAGMAAQLVTAGMLGRVLCLLPTGQIIDRYGRRPMLIGAPLLVALGSAATAIAPFFWLVLVAQFFAGAGMSAWLVAREVALVDIVRPEQRGRMVASFHGMGSVGVAIGPAIGGVLTDHFGFRAVYWAFALTALFTVLVGFTIRETARAKTTARGSMFNFGKLSEVDPQFRSTYVVIVGNTFVAMMRGALIVSLIPLYLGLQLGYSSTEVGKWFSLYGLVNVAMIMPTGFILDKFGRKAAVIPSVYLASLVFLIFPLIHGTLPLLVLAVCTGIANGLSLGTMATWTYDVIPEHARARMQALRRVIADVGAFLGPALGGVIADAASPGAVFWAFLPLQLIAALTITFLAKESLHHASAQRKEAATRG